MQAESMRATVCSHFCARSHALAGAGAPDMHVPPAHTSPAVHALPSPQGAVFAPCIQVPAPSQTSSVQVFVSLVQVLPCGSNRQRDEQQSPSTALPSWQSSPGSITPFKHLVPVTVPEPTQL